MSMDRNDRLFLQVGLGLFAIGNGLYSYPSQDWWIGPALCGVLYVGCELWVAAKRWMQLRTDSLNSWSKSPEGISAIKSATEKLKIIAIIFSVFAALMLFGMIDGSSGDIGAQYEGDRSIRGR